MGAVHATRRPVAFRARCTGTGRAARSAARVVGERAGPDSRHRRALSWHRRVLRYFTRNGREIPLYSEADCAAAIRKGDLHAGSLVMDGATGRWTRAAEHPMLASLLERVKVDGPAGAASGALKALAIGAWVAALAGPAFIARAIGVDTDRVLGRSALAAVLLCAVGALALVFVRTAVGRWRLSLILALLVAAAGIGAAVS